MDLIKKLREPVLSKVGEKVADYVLNVKNNIMDYDSIVTTLKDNLKSLSSKASDVEHHIKNAELSGKKKRKREVEVWLTQVKSIEAAWAADADQPEGLQKRLRGRATELNQQVQKLFKQSCHFGELLLDVCGAGRVNVVATKVVGKAFEENLKNIWELLETGKKSPIAVYGMGGAGKTTLVEHIHSRLVEQSPRNVFFVTVSHKVINIKSLQGKIASSLGVPNLLDGDDEVVTRAGKLRGVLSKMNNSVLILDDVWENINLSELGCVVSKECCMLIITTRSTNVCEGMECEARIDVQKLDEDEAWELFREKLGKVTILSSEVENIAQSMAKICGRLPLAIVTVAGSMKGVTTEERWRDSLVRLEECVVGDADNDKVFRVLKYSFDQLRKYALNESNEFNLSQLCFLYCSLYPEDYEIEIEELVEKLISNGLVEKRKSRRQEVDSGHAIVENLVNVCLLESFVDSCDRKCVKMHDLVRGMALKIVGGKYMVRAGDKSIKEIPKEQEWTEQLEKVSLMHNDIMEIGEITSPNCPNLETLLLHHNFDLRIIPDNFFWRMQRLQTLDLGHTGISKLSKSVSELKSLEALRLYHCHSLNYVPNLGKLKLLRELDLTITGMEDVPEGVGELINLKFLSLAQTKLKVFPRGLLPKLVGLQILRLPAHVQVAKKDIQKLKQLEKFSGGVENVGDFNSLIRNQAHARIIYVIQVGTIGESHFPFENVVENVVVLTGCNFKDEEVVLGQDIKRLTLRSCEGLSSCLFDDLPRLNNPTSLRGLEFESCGVIECILRSEPQLSSRFSNLEKIVLDDLEDFKGLVYRGEDTEGASVAPPLVFSSLTWLTIVKCNKLRRLGLSLSEFPNLKHLHISECSEIEEIFKDEPGREKEEIGGLEESTAPSQPPLSFYSFKQIEINECNKVRKLGISALEVPNLEYLHITECSKIEEIFEDHQEISSGVAPLLILKALSLEGLPSLKSVCKAPIISNSIRSIAINKCPKLMKKMPLHLDHPLPPNLRCIEACEEWWKSLEWDNPNLPNLLLPILYHGGGETETDEDTDSSEYSLESDDISTNSSTESASL